jgi:hypothetical protein
VTREVEFIKCLVLQQVQEAQVGGKEDLDIQSAACDSNQLEEIQGSLVKAEHTGALSLEWIGSE